MTKQIFLPSDGPTGTPSLRTLGTGATQAAAGNDSRLSDTRTPTAHASTHDVGGSDVLKDLTRLAAGPAVNGYTAWTGDPMLANSNVAPIAGRVYLLKIMTAHAYTINNIDFQVGGAGTGATPLANCFIGIYDSGGIRRYLSPDQSSNWASSGAKSLGSVGYLVTANDFIYIALLVGTQSTTTVKISSATLDAISVNMGLTAAAYRCAFNLTGQSSLTSPLTLSSSSLSATGQWFGVK